MDLGLKRIGWVFALPAGFWLAGCAQPGSDGGSSVVASKPEATYCVGGPVAGGITVTSQANYQRYEDSSSGLNSVSTYPIRYAEIQVINLGTGFTANCAETDSSGAVSITIPRVAGSYLLKVNSRANNGFYKASVLNNPSTNDFYSITATFSVAGSEGSVPVTLAAAAYNGSLEGGAFNILDNVLKANDYLRSNTSCGSCTTFTVAPHLKIFWTPGFNPGHYISPSYGGISFFSSGGSLTTGLYILGGSSGSVCTDTDHFDNSVVLHEYGHYLESVYAGSDSPGGSHSGNAVIDPRLAWSEGWANFFQAAVLSRNVYRDTVSNAACGNASLAFSDFSMEAQTADVPTYTDEGTFREMSVARTLYKSILSGYADLGFSLLWKAFSNASAGLASTTARFRNSGLFHQYLNTVVGAEASGKQANYDSVLSGEEQRKDTLNYGYPLTAQTGATCTFSFGAAVPVNPNLTTSYLLRNNKYYQYYYDGSAARAVVNLRYSATGTPYDLNLYVYNESYVFGSASTMAASSANTYPEAGSVETINLTGRAAGYYLINVQVNYSGARAATTYYLENANGDRLCP